MYACVCVYAYMYVCMYVSIDLLNRHMIDNAQIEIDINRYVDG